MKMQETLSLKLIHLIVSIGNMIIILANTQSRCSNSLSNNYLSQFNIKILVRGFITGSLSLSFCLILIDLILYRRLVKIEG